MNVSITPTAEALIHQLLALGYENPEAIVEEALQCYYSQQRIDTSLGFSELSEAEILQANETRWETFQQQNISIPHSDVEARFLGSSSRTLDP
ncbi:MAG: hypothetical protein AAFY15_16540 [Cyanobacteria bacterium J06648_11]